jgi:hypothetical protein
MHVGTEKTGSSFLQKLCGKNRDYLLENGIWFPDAGRFERQLQEGSISPGNSSDLAQFLEDSDWARASSWLAKRVEEARSKGCEHVLLSNELLFAAMSKVGAIRNFEGVAAEAGIRDVSCLLLVRNPVDHALSLYKHRAKGGKTGAIGDWISRGYPLPQQLAGFLSGTDGGTIRLHLRKYDRAAEPIEKIFFNDWLKVDSPPNAIESLVNPSLSLSELALIQHITLVRPNDQPAFYASFLSVPVADKADDTRMKDTAIATVEKYLCRYNTFWGELDTRLVADGGLKIPQERDIVGRIAPKYEFSEAQLRALAQAHTASLSFRYAVNHWIRASLRPRVGSLIRKVVPAFRQR